MVDGVDILIMDLIEFERITIECLQHKYRYWELDKPSITDYDYDKLAERRRELGLMVGRDSNSNWIKFDKSHPLSRKATEEL